MVCLLHNSLISDVGPKTVMRSVGTSEDKILPFTNALRDSENAEYSRELDATYLLKLSWLHSDDQKKKNTQTSQVRGRTWEHQLIDDL